MDRIQRRDKAGDLFEQGKSMEEIADTLNCSVSSVTKYIAELQLRPKRAVGLDKKIVHLHIKGYNNTQIAYELNISKSYVYKILKINGFSGHGSYEDLIDENTQYAVDLKAIPLEKMVIKGKWQDKNGVRFRKNKHYTDITPLFSPR